MAAKTKTVTIQCTCGRNPSCVHCHGAGTFGIEITSLSGNFDEPLKTRGKSTAKLGIYDPDDKLSQPGKVQHPLTPRRSPA